MTGNELRQRIRDGQRVYGSLIVADSPRWLGIIEATGLDFVFIDIEHISIDRKTLSWMCLAYRQLGKPPIVRIPSPDPYEATKALDAGACGILSPYMEKIEDVERLISAVKIRPFKGQKAVDLVSGSFEPESPLKKYLENHNKDHLLLINIESRTGVENMDKLLAYDALDGIIVGPHDLSCSYDMPEAYDDRRFVDLVSTIMKKARGMSKGAGIHVTFDAIDQEIEWAKAGANIILHKADIILFREHIERELNQIRSALGETTDRESEKKNINI